MKAIEEKRYNINIKMLYFIMPVLALCTLFAQGKVVNAATAKQIVSSTLYTDSLGNNDEEKLYQFTMDKDGYFNLTFAKENPVENAGNGWYVAIYEDSTVIYDTDGTQGFQTPCIDFAKGTTFIIQVKQKLGGGWSYPIDVNYTLRIDSYQDLSWEQEKNDTMKTATALANGFEKTGNVWSMSDADYYSFTIEKQGYFIFDFTLEDVTKDYLYGYTIAMFDEQGTEILNLDRQTGNYHSEKYNFMKGSKIYIKITCNWNSSAPVYQNYYIKLNNVENSSWEKENKVGGDASLNDQVSADNKLSSTPITGHLYDWFDTGVYKYSIPSDGAVKLTFNVDNDLSNYGYGYYIAFLDKNGKLINTYEDLKTNQLISQEMPAGNCYIKVYSRREFGMPAPCFNEYTISATFKAGLSFSRVKPSIKKPKILKSFGNKRSVNIKWKKTKGANGYKIYRSTKNNKGYKCVKTITNNYTNSWIDTKVKKKKTYYYKIKAYQDFYGKKITCKYSGVKKIKVK